MSTLQEQNKAIARRFYEEALNGKNLDIIAELFAANYQAHPPGAPEPLSREAFKQFISLFHAGFPDFHLTFEDEIAEGDKVVLLITAHGTHQGEFLGIPPTGKPATWTGISISRLADGKIVEQWGEQDFLGLLQQLGAIPAPAQGGS
jgi:steroid delta-isomerase-like uncharacterized protein